MDITVRLYLHYYSQVSAAVTVVGSRPDRHQVLLLEPLLIALLHQLMGTHYQLQPVMLVKFSHHTIPK
jgi:hypothetical protein